MPHSDLENLCKKSAQMTKNIPNAVGHVYLKRNRTICHIERLPTPSKNAFVVFGGHNHTNYYHHDGCKLIWIESKTELVVVSPRGLLGTKDSTGTCRHHGKHNQPLGILKTPYTWQNLVYEWVCFSKFSQNSAKIERISEKSY